MRYCLACLILLAPIAVAFGSEPAGRTPTAAEEARTKTFWKWRDNYPARDLSPRPTDGRNLALSVRKLKQGFSPDRTFLIWGIGPSYLNMLGDGNDLIQHLYKRFPNGPRIVYKKIVGSSVPWQFVAGWANNAVVPEQPDLVLLYGIGSEENLEKLFRTIRKRTTADIIIASVHWKLSDKKDWGVDPDATVYQDIPKLRKLCQKYGVEFVENRNEWADYLIEHNLEIEVDREHGLLSDAVHQSRYGALVINENFVRHFAQPKTPAYDPNSRERRLLVGEFASPENRKRIVPDPGKWEKSGNTLSTSTKDAAIRIAFRGNRIDLVGVQSEAGGTARIVIDGQPADRAPCFYASHIKCGKKNTRPARGMLSDASPHGSSLGRNVVPQTWTISMTDDAGNFTISGSVTGPDGGGSALKPFTSASGQIILSPETWRHGCGCVPFMSPWNGKLTNKAGDTFTFDVRRCAVGSVDFKGEPGKRFGLKLVENLANKDHVLEVIANGDGPVTIEALDVYEPPLK